MVKANLCRMPWTWSPAVIAAFLKAQAPDLSIQYKHRARRNDAKRDRQRQYETLRSGFASLFLRNRHALCPQMYLICETMWRRLSARDKIKFYLRQFVLSVLNHLLPVVCPWSCFELYDHGEPLLIPVAWCVIIGSFVKIV